MDNLPRFRPHGIKGASGLWKKMHTVTKCMTDLCRPKQLTASCSDFLLSPLVALNQHFVEKIAGKLRDESEFADVTLAGDDE